jgi:hypothetical protein
MRVVAGIDDRGAAEKIFRHLPIWHCSPPRPSTCGLPRFSPFGREEDFRGRAGNRK